MLEVPVTLTDTQKQVLWLHEGLVLGAAGPQDGRRLSHVGTSPHAVGVDFGHHAHALSAEQPVVSGGSARSCSAGTAMIWAAAAVHGHSMG